jgi:hypothetical protein
VAVVPLLNGLGGPTAILGAGIALAGAAMIWAESRSSRRNAGWLALALVALTAANYSGRLIDVVYAKGMFRDPAWVEFARWNALSRVEVDRQGQAKAIVIDADASTYIMNADVKQWHDTEWEKNLMSAGLTFCVSWRLRHYRPRRRGGCTPCCRQRQCERHWNRDQSHHRDDDYARALRRLCPASL